MGELSPTHWLIVIVVAVVLFGARRLPDAARSLGRSARILKSEISGIHDDAKPADPAPADAEAPAQPAAPPALESAPPSADATAPSTTPVSAEQPAAAAPVKSEADVQGGGVRS
ncbi:MAG: sec-independent protein translocase protein TatA [Pseudonocardiales bacterium]|jgi:sec-independent protein translocase protein TatA|nr:sec-independent protein translocase protein TatA [Pseudonocardiales bacterium]MDT7623257.1 sec-independent protein translocase protein TatA [Pseudonocardiales bacterium]